VTKPTAQQIRNLIVNKPLEILKTAREQISPINQPEPNENKPKEDSEPINEQKLESQKSRRIEALDAELNQIRRDNLFKDLQRKIAEGEEIPLENYIKELGSEEREVLKAQMEAVKTRKVASENKSKDSLPQIISKKARGMVGGMVKKRNQQHVETQKMPSN
jgi:uncharacterized protein YPO0396